MVKWCNWDFLWSQSHSIYTQYIAHFCWHLSTAAWASAVSRCSLQAWEKCFSERKIQSMPAGKHLSLMPAGMPVCACMRRESIISIRQQRAYVSISQHTLAYVSREACHRDQCHLYIIYFIYFYMSILATKVLLQSVLPWEYKGLSCGLCKRCSLQKRKTRKTLCRTTINQRNKMGAEIKLTSSATLKYKNQYVCVRTSSQWRMPLWYRAVANLYINSIYIHTQTHAHTTSSRWRKPSWYRAVEYL